MHLSVSFAFIDLNSSCLINAVFLCVYRALNRWFGESFIHCFLYFTHLVIRATKNRNSVTEVNLLHLTICCHY